MAWALRRGLGTEIDRDQLCTELREGPSRGREQQGEGSEVQRSFPNPRGEEVGAAGAQEP